MQYNDLDTSMNCISRMPFVWVEIAVKCRIMHELAGGEGGSGDILFVRAKIAVKNVSDQWEQKDSVSHNLILLGGEGKICY